MVLIYAYQRCLAQYAGGASVTQHTNRVVPNNTCFTPQKD